MTRTKTGLAMALAGLALIGLSGCHVAGHAPPGQVKKILDPPPGQVKNAGKVPPGHAK